ncbi:MAG: hypothetical protein KTR14_06415 [Vampirovibrio sp.]|nr:hypothetical protein [Vampirovibrio sp.]
MSTPAQLRMDTLQLKTSRPNSALKEERGQRALQELDLEALKQVLSNTSGKLAPLKADTLDLVLNQARLSQMRDVIAHGETVPSHVYVIQALSQHVDNSSDIIHTVLNRVRNKLYHQIAKSENN